MERKRRGEHLVPCERKGKRKTVRGREREIVLYTFTL